MTTTVDIIIVAIAMAMDCFTVSIAAGVIMKRMEWRVVASMSMLFGLFQALMPLIGWTAVNYVSRYVQTASHWIAFALLTMIGVKMIVDSTKDSDTPTFNPRRLKTQLLLAVATSIDALAIGMSMAVMGQHTTASLTVPLIVIGLVSALFTVIGHVMGVTMGKTMTQRIKPAALGGLLLIIIGVKALMD